MTLVNRIDKSWKLTFTALIVTLLVAVSLISVPTSVFGAETDEITIPESYFKIVDVRSNHGHLVVEAQHFNEDKTHWHYNLYSFGGNEAFVKEKVLNDTGEALLEDGSVAPFMWVDLPKEKTTITSTLDIEQVPIQFVPYDTIRFEHQQDQYDNWFWNVVAWNGQFSRIDTSKISIGMNEVDIYELFGEPEERSIDSSNFKGDDRAHTNDGIFLDYKYRASADWMYGDFKLSSEDILDVISTIHLQRLGTGWNEDRGRTVLEPTSHTSKEVEGADILRDHFSSLKDTAYKLNDEGKAELFNGSLDPTLNYVELVDERTQNSKTYILGETEKKVVLQENTHYQDTKGDWQPSSLDWVEAGEGTYVMGTHPNFYGMGKENHIAVKAIDTEFGGRWYTPSPLTYDGANASYTHDGITWTYVLTGNGLKLTSEPLEARGLQSYEFVFMPIGDGVQPLRIDSGGNAVTGDIEVEIPEDQQGMYFYYYNDIDDGPDLEPSVIIPRPFIIGANNHKYDAGSWEVLDNYRIGFSFDDSVLPPDAFPYSIDPTTTLNDSNYIEDSVINSQGGTGGSETGISVGSTSGNGSSAVRMLIKWGNLNLIPSDAVVTHAEIQLYEHNADDAAQMGETKIDVMRIKSDWTESGVTWTATGAGTSWPCAGMWCGSAIDTNLSATGSAQGYNTNTGTSYSACNCWHTLAGSRLTQDVNKFISGDYPNYGWLFASIYPKELNYSGVSFNMFSSAEHSNGNAPRLVITYEYASVYTCPTSSLLIEEPKEDGQVVQNDGFGSGVANFRNKRGAPVGSNGGYSGAYGVTHTQWDMAIRLFTHCNSGACWAIMSRGYIVWDTSALPDDAIITDANMILWPTGARDTWVNSGALNSEHIRLVKIGNWNDETNWTSHHNDFGKVGDPDAKSDETFGNAPMAFDQNFFAIMNGLDVNSSYPWSQADNADYLHPGHPMVWNLNSAGIDHIDKTGFTPFGIRFGHDIGIGQDAIGGGLPAPGGDNWLTVTFTTKNHMSHPGNEFRGNDLRPKMRINYTRPCAMMDSTSTVSQTTTTTVYTNSSYEDGYITADMPPSNDAWEYFRIRDYHLYCNTNGTDYSCASAGIQASQGTANNSISSFATKIIIGETNDFCNFSSYYARMGANKCYDVIERAIISFDTSALPDYYTGGCSTNTTTFYPSKDGETEHILNNSRWDAIMSGSGNGSNPNGSTGLVSFNTTLNWGTNGSTAFSNIERLVIRFDTSSLPSDAIPTYARLGYVADVKGQHFNTDVMLVETWAENNNAWNVENADYGNFGNMPFAHPMDLNFVVADDTTVNWMVMNNDGLAYIKPDGITELGLRMAADAWSYPPVNSSEWQADKNEYITVYMNEAGGSQRPRLEVTYQTGCGDTGVHSASIGLAANNTNLEGSYSFTSMVRAFPGNVANPGAQDWLRWYPIKMTSDRTNQELFLDGTTYNEFVLNSIGRAYLMDNHNGASSFMVMDRHDAEDWQPDNFNRNNTSSVEWVSNEGSTAPRLMITHGNNTGTFGTADAFHSAGKTLIVNLAGTKFVASGGTFDAQRQNIINGLVGNLGTATDWNTAVKGNMAVTEVVRTDDDTITITFGAHTGYAPSAATETITVTIPASAHSGSTDLVVPLGIKVAEIPFQFASFTPTLASNTASFNMTLSGAGLPEHSFTGSEDVRLIKGGQSDIVCTSVSGTGGTSVVVSCPVTGAVVGTWDVKATNGTGLNDTKSAALTLYQAWSSPVNGGSFTPGGSEYAAFAHDDLPYFTVHAFDEVEKEWGAGSSPPADIPAAAGKDAIFSMDKTRLVVSTASNANTLWAYEFTTGTIGAKSNPGTAIVQDINDIDFSTNDNAIAVAAGGGDRVYMYNVDHSVAIGSFWTGIVATPASNPGSGTCNSIDFNDNSTYVAVGCSVSPYLHVWNVTNGGSGTPSFGSKLSDPGVLPSGAISSVQFSADGTQIAIATDTSPYVEVYEFNGGVIGNKSSNPATLPTGVATGVAWLHENTTGITNLAVSHETSPYLSIYNFTTDAAAAGVFGTKLADPGTSLTSNSNMVAFHPNDDTLFVGQDSSPYMTAYEYTGVSDDDYRTYRYMANFDTSYLPDDAVITNAVLSLYIDSVNVGTDWQLLIQDGVNGSEPLVSSDNDYLKYVGGSLGSLTASSVSVGSYNDINLSGFGPISNTGITQLMLRHEEDIANSAPTVVETVDIEVGGSGTFPGDCHTASPTAITSDSDYNLCNSPNVPILKLQYTSVSTGGTAPDITVTADPSGVGIDEESGASSTYGTYPITAWQKGPIAFLGIESFGNLLYSTSVARLLTDNSNDWNFFTSSAPNKPFTHIKDLYLLNGTYPKASSLGNITASTNNLKYQVGGTIQAQMIDATRSSPGASDDESTTLMSLPSDDTTISSSSGLTVTSTSTLLDLGTQPTIPEIAAETSDSVMSDIMETSTTGNTGIPGEPFWNYIETSVGMPSGTVILTLALVLTIMGGVIAYMSFQSVAASYITIMILLASFTLSFGGILPWWMVLTFGLTGGIFVFARRSSV